MGSLLLDFYPLRYCEMASMPFRSFDFLLCKKSWIYHSRERSSRAIPGGPGKADACGGQNYIHVVSVKKA
jgi:hypothetical protein